LSDKEERASTFATLFIELGEVCKLYRDDDQWTVIAALIAKAGQIAIKVGLNEAKFADLAHRVYRAGSDIMASQDAYGVIHANSDDLIYKKK